MWINSLFSFVLAAAFCLLFTPVFRRFGSRMHIYTASGGRHVNRSPVPRLGGAPVFISFFAALCVIFYAKGFFNLNLPQVAAQSLLLPLFCGAAMVWLLGLWDDIRHIRARYKLLVQIAVAAGAYLLGLQIHAIYFPMIGALNLGDYSLPFTVLWIVGIINAINFIDGVDGLCSSIVISSLLGISCLAIIFGVDTGAIICFALTGCLLAFLAFNFHPAVIFLGDSGAYFLGFMIAAMPVFIAAKSSSPGQGVLHASFILFLLIPFMDTGLAIIRRRIMHIPMSTPDRGHLHHRLLDKGYTHKKTTAIMSLFSLVFVAAGITAAIGNHWQTTAAFLTAAAAAFLLLNLCGVKSLRGLKSKHAMSATKAVLLKEYAPSLLHDLNGATDWTQAKKILDDFCWNTKMGSVYIICQKNAGNYVAWNWHNKFTAMCRRQPQVNKTYTVLYDDSCYQFYFCWDSEYSSVQKDTDALLEVISKAVGKSCHEKFFSSGAALEKAALEKNEDRLVAVECDLRPRMPIKSAEKIHASGI
ncbi:MAG: undecaprenyl/decaprenyl-phosphate alpha-N-acetylglucosaminyl 1-phosphate transferase [Acidobacteriota bacterium]|jgi:UDP-GlcNAc:undecaprenyl-phosphate GlcNAc-1-phosphate transferase|nr:undecaprenyl/decaprenyl-phosphate alpha-N-acetylglucosaminyl 1-phosphate transferase [Acidobacteriota bacterium]